MKVGLSSYSVLEALNDGRLTIVEAISWVKENGGSHLELVPYGYSVVDNYALADEIKERAKARRLNCLVIVCLRTLSSRQERRLKKK